MAITAFSPWRLATCDLRLIHLPSDLPSAATESLDAVPERTDGPTGALERRPQEIGDLLEPADGAERTVENRSGDPDDPDSGEEDDQAGQVQLEENPE